MILFSKNGSFSQRIILFGAPQKDAIKSIQNLRSYFLLDEKMKEGVCASRQLFKMSRESISEEFRKIEKSVFMSFFSRTQKKRIILYKDVNPPSTDTA